MMLAFSFQFTFIAENILQNWPKNSRSLITLQVQTKNICGVKQSRNELGRFTVTLAFDNSMKLSWKIKTKQKTANDNSQVKNEGKWESERFVATNFCHVISAQCRAVDRAN